MIIIGIDPGTIESGYCLVDNYKVLDSDKVENKLLFQYIDCADVVAVESMQSYGMAVGREFIETCYMIGRIQEFCHRRTQIKDMPIFLYPRPEYAKAIIGGNKVSDSLLRAALDQRFGEPGKDAYKKDGPLYALRGASDKRSAYAVAIYHLDCLKYSQKEAR